MLNRVITIMECETFTWHVDLASLLLQSQWKHKLMRGLREKFQGIKIKNSIPHLPQPGKGPAIHFLS